jgi:hypothetical protein
MSNQQQGQGGGFNPNKQPPTDKKEFKKDTKQKKVEGSDEDMDSGACASKGGSCGSSMDDQEEE